MVRDAEITLEANPDSACDVKALRALRRAGFNRISLGVQSADDGLLRAIGRIHTFAQVQEAVAAVRKAGFKNLSMDLIYGLPRRRHRPGPGAYLLLRPEAGARHAPV